MTTDHIKLAFNKAAPYYDKSCDLQLQTGRKLISQLKNLNLTIENILDVGCGTGIVTEILASQFSYNNLYAIDIADKLLLAAQQKLLNKKVHTLLADFNDLTNINILFDVIYANLSLHWSYDIQHTLFSLKQKLTHDGILAFSMPIINTFQEIKNYCSINNFNSLKTMENLLINSGFSIINISSQLLTFNFNNLFDSLKSIKAVGAGFVMPAQRDNEAFKKLRMLIRNKNPENSFPLTYNIGYFFVKNNT